MDTDFLLTSLIVVASPGTGALLTLAAGLSQGARAATFAALGCTLGVLPHMAAAVTGLAAVLHASPFAFELLRHAGVVYLLYMAWQVLRADGPLAIDAQALPRRPALQLIRHAVLVNLLNPKLSMFFLAFLPQFLAPDEAHPARALLGLSLVFMGMTFVVFVLYGVFAAQARRHLLARPAILRWMRRGFAAAFVALGLRLWLAPR